jgi:hypothetical protein
MAGKAHNPTEYKQDFMTLASTAPHEAAEVAMKWRERFVNQAEVMKKGTEDIMEIGVAGISSFGIAFLDGGWEAKREKMIRDWEEGGAADAAADLEEHPTPFSHPEGEKDPTKLFNMVDNVLVATLGLAALAAFNVLKKYTPVLRAAALGTGAYWAGSLGRSLGYKRAEKALSAEADEAKAA